MRVKLPNRRPNETVAAAWGGISFTVTIGYDPVSGEIREVFADTAKGGHMQATLADACVLISRDLQKGATIPDLCKSLARVTDPMAGAGVTRPASPIGAIMEVLL